jgi:diguanylate cyclase
VSNQAVKTARAALHLMTARGLPPTPENYSSVYRTILGEQPEAVRVPEEQLTAEQKLDNSRELVDLIRILVTAITDKTGNLADDLDLQSQNMQKSIDVLEHTEERQEIGNLLKIILGTAHTIQNSVEDAHREISQSRRKLEEIRVELVEAKRQVLLDPLTGARNRFGMDSSLGQEVARAKRGDGKLSIAMLDMDYFKKVNDEYGHNAGDQALVYFVQLSRAVLRESDTMYRYGGEEFMVTLPETDLQGATFMLDRLAQMLAKSPLIYQGKKVRLTFSGGVATLREGDNSTSLLARSDQALYQAKQQGRNRLVTDQESA